MADPNKGLPNERLLELYRRWADGGSGIILTGNVMVDRKCKEAPRNVVLDDEDDTSMDLFKKWAQSITETTASKEDIAR